MTTRKETLRILCKSIITRLENRKSISFAPRLRQIVQDEIFDLVQPFIYTDEDLREKTLAKISAKSENLTMGEFTETDQYKAARAVIRADFGDNVLHGFFFQRPLKTLAGSIVQYFMRSSHIDDVYEIDEDLERQIIEIVQKFNPSELH